jgi:hypothetical protein
MICPFSFNFVRADIYSLISSIFSVIDRKIDDISFSELADVIRKEDSLVKMLSLPRLNDHELAAITFTKSKVDLFLIKFYK